jgi:cobalt/nickel transport system permease protein
MSVGIENALYDLGRLDRLADEGDSFIHRLDPTAKVLTTLVYIVAVVSFDRYAIGRLLPYFLYPAVLIGLGDLPFFYFVKKLLLVSPFVLCIGIFNPFLDRNILLHLGPVAITGGWISFASILLRFTLTVSAGLLLIATTGFPAICLALNRMGAPRIFTVQLLFLYRYLFVLTEESIRMLRAHSLRALGRGMRFATARDLLGNLLLRTLARAQRIHLAMLSRSFTGDIRLVRQSRIGPAELLFSLGAITIFILLRFHGPTQFIGQLLLGNGQ